MEKIFLVSNKNTLDLKKFASEKPLSFAFLKLQDSLDNSGMKLLFVNQDKNRVYFRVRNNINKYVSPVMEYSNEELLSLNVYDVAGLKEEVWGKGK